MMCDNHPHQPYCPNLCFVFSSSLFLVLSLPPSFRNSGRGGRAISGSTTVWSSAALRRATVCLCACVHVLLRVVERWTGVSDGSDGGDELGLRMRQRREQSSGGCCLRG